MRRPGRPGWREKCERLLAFDIRLIAHKCLLVPPGCFGWHWSRGATSFHVLIRVEAEDRILLRYMLPGHDPAQEFDYSVSLDRTPCHFGGSRPWLLCPRCNARRGVLYGPARDGRFGCIACLRLGYAVESEGELDRLLRKEHKLERQLEEGWRRPEGMHRRRYARIHEKLEDVEQTIEARARARFGVYLGRW